MQTRNRGQFAIALSGCYTARHAWPRVSVLTVLQFTVNRSSAWTKSDITTAQDPQVVELHMDCGHMLSKERHIIFRYASLPSTSYALRASPDTIRSVAGLHFHWRLVAGYALPLAVRHFAPSIGEAFIGIERLTRWIGAFASKVSDGDRSVAEDHHLQVNVVDASVFGRFGFSYRFGSTGHFAVGRGVGEAFSQKRLDQFHIVCPLGLKPLVLEICDSFLSCGVFLGLRPCRCGQHDNSQHKPWNDSLHRASSVPQLPCIYLENPPLRRVI